MKTYIIIAIMCLSTAVSIAQQTKNIDTRNSIVNWTGHAEIGSYAPAGTLSFKEGKVSVKDGKVIDATLIIDMTTMKQSNNDLVTHLKSADFFDVDKYPISTIKISRVTSGQAFGQLTIKDKTQPLSCPVKIQTINGKMTITGSLTIDRTRYGVIYNSNSFFANLGDHAIRNTFDVSFSIVL